MEGQGSRETAGSERCVACGRDKQSGGEVREAPLKGKVVTLVL